jgi:hypothetical protein
MAIGLTAKISPKNDAFAGMVDAANVIGTISGGGFLPSSCINEDSISESYLKINNTPTNDYYLQYSDANGMQWAEVVGGSDVAWSGASEFYAVSSSLLTRFRDSSATWNYVSSQYVSTQRILTDDIHFHGIQLEEDESKYHTVRHWFRLFNSAGRISGGGIYSSQTDGGTFTISGGQGLLREEDNDYAKLYWIEWITSSNIYVATGSAKYCGVKYNSGNPVAFAQDTNTYDYDTNFPLGTVVNRSGQLCILNNPWWTSDSITNIIERFDAKGHIIRDEITAGLTLGESGDGNRKVTVSAGKLWSRLNEFDITAKDTAVSDTFVGAYRDGSTGFKFEYGLTQWTNSQYDDNSGILQTISNNKYANCWFYALATNQIMMLYGRTIYDTAAQAEAGTPPATVPLCIQEQGLLIGRIIVKGGVTTAQAVQSAFNTVFTPTQVTDHGNLAGLTDDDHPQYFNDIRLTTISGNAVSGAMIAYSGSKYTDSYIWYNTSSNQFSDWLASGEKLSRWFFESSSKLSTSSGTAWSGASEFYAMSSNYNSHSNDATIHFTVGSINFDDLANTSIDNVSGNSIVWNGSEWIDKNVTSEPGALNLSSITIDTDKDWQTYSIYNATSVSSSRVSGGALQSNTLTVGNGTTYTQMRSGWGSVANAGTITHGCITKPTCVYVTPSGSIPFMYCFKVDDSNITIYHTSPDDEVFSWFATV